MKRSVFLYLRSLVWVLLLVLLDQGSKLWAARYLKQGDDIVLISGVLRLHYLYPENRGIAFGLFQGSVLFFGLVSILLIVFLLWILSRIPDQNRYLPMRVGVVWILAGAAGNLIDRMFRGYVIDFIYFELIDFPLFNAADVFVVCGAFLFAFLSVFFYRKEEDFDFLRRRQ